MGNVHMEAAQINYRGGEKKMSVEEALKSTSGEAAAIAQLQTDVANLRDVKANQITIAPTFSAETSYDPGDLVYYNGLSYRCVNSHEGEWDADDFAATTISNELASLMSGLITESVTVTNSDKLASGSTLWCMRMGKVVVVEYYLITATDCANGDVLATLDLPYNFSFNYFTEISQGANTYGLNLKLDTKTLTADSNIATGAKVKGQLVGLTY